MLWQSTDIPDCVDPAPSLSCPPPMLLFPLLLLAIPTLPPALIPLLPTPAVPSLLIPPLDPNKLFLLSKNVRSCVSTMSH